MKLIIAMMAALLISTPAMANHGGDHGGGDGGSTTFAKAMQYNDAAMEKYRAKH